MMTAKDIITGKKTASAGKFSHKTVEARQEEKRPKKKRRLTWRELLVVLIPAVAAVLAVVIVLVTTEKATTYTFSDSGRQYFAGASAVVRSGAHLQLNENGGVTFADEDAELQNETTLPVYLDNSRAIVLTTNMVYYAPREGLYQQAPMFSQILCQENGMITVSRDGASTPARAGFLYDGEDFYLFLEPMTVTFKGYVVELSSLSYAYVVNGGEIMLFDYATKTFTIEMLEGSAVAESGYGDYAISLLGDSMTDLTGEKSLLVTRPELFEPMV